MTPSPPVSPPASRGRSPLFWVALVAGGLCFVCGLELVTQSKR